MAEKKVPKTLLNRIDRWNKKKADLMKEYREIEREARKRGLVAPKTREKKRWQNKKADFADTINLPKRCAFLITLKETVDSLFYDRFF